tara:strand:+ start:106 stop:579 length:474 start_codon:yes stop_codon:yes gene_type:complete
MKKIKSIILINILLIIFLGSCSYQKMNSENQKKFYIQEFEITGDNRESFIIQKKIQRFSNKESSNRIKITIDLIKGKNIQEKNIQNKVTKYALTLTANVKIIELSTNKIIQRDFTAKQTYNVDDSYSNTVNNSKEASNSLIDTIVDEIIDQLRVYYN